MNHSLDSVCRSDGRFGPHTFKGLCKYVTCTTDLVSSANEGVGGCHFTAFASNDFQLTHETDMIPLPKNSLLNSSAPFGLFSAAAAVPS